MLAESILERDKERGRRRRHSVTSSLPAGSPRGEAEGKAGTSDAAAAQKRPARNMMVRVLHRNTAYYKKRMQALQVDTRGIDIMLPKTTFSVVEIGPLRSWQAQILKQKMLSLGSDAAVSRKSLVKDCQTSCMLFGTERQLTVMAKAMRVQPFGLPEVSRGILNAVRSSRQRATILTFRKRKLVIGTPLLMGILNVTGDSFSGDGILSCASRVIDPAELVRKVQQMVNDGMDILDVGGESSRPGSRRLSAREELKRVIPVLKAIRKQFPRLIISVDTYKAEVASAAVCEAAIDIVNDISALRMDKKMPVVIRKYDLAVVLMHMQGSPRTMQKNPRYADVCAEVFAFLHDRISWAQERGIPFSNIIVDPGIGFGKTVEHNTELLQNLDEFKALGRPILIGTSRKSFIGRVLKQEDPRQRLTGSLCSVYGSLMSGARMVRVHDIKPTREVIDFYAHIYQ